MNYHNSHLHNTTGTSIDELFLDAKKSYSAPLEHDYHRMMQHVTLLTSSRNTSQRNPSIPSLWFQWMRNGMIGVGALAALLLVVIGGNMTMSSSLDHSETFEQTIAYETLQEEASFEHDLMTQEDALVGQEIDAWLSGVVDQTVS